MASYQHFRLIVHRLLIEQSELHFSLWNSSFFVSAQTASNIGLTVFVASIDGAKSSLISILMWMHKSLALNLQIQRDTIMLLQLQRSTDLTRLCHHLIASGSTKRLAAVVGFILYASSWFSELRIPAQFWKLCVIIMSRICS